MTQVSPDSILRQISTLKPALRHLRSLFSDGALSDSFLQRFLTESGDLCADLIDLRQQIAPERFGSIGITLDRSDSIAKFFAFSFANRDTSPLSSLRAKPFFGSGVYAIYYVGESEKAYAPLSGTETPIYLGKANPKDPYAETIEAQGKVLWKRLNEHAKNIHRADNLWLSDFRYRAAAIQSGMQPAVEAFMIRLFRPTWNKEINICYGIGKHGDSASPRRNKRSPWDTMHPGRAWADATKQDQIPRKQIEDKIRAHLEKHPPIQDQKTLFKLLALD